MCCGVGYARTRRSSTARCATETITTPLACAISTSVERSLILRGPRGKDRPGFRSEARRRTIRFAILGVQAGSSRHIGRGVLAFMPFP